MCVYVYIFIDYMNIYIYIDIDLFILSSGHTHLYKDNYGDADKWNLQNRQIPRGTAPLPSPRAPFEKLGSPMPTNYSYGTWTRKWRNWKGTQLPSLLYCTIIPLVAIARARGENCTIELRLGGEWGAWKASPQELHFISDLQNTWEFSELELSACLIPRRCGLFSFF